MNKKRTLIFVISLVIILVPAIIVKAQTETPPDEEAPTSQTGFATGIIINQSPGGEVPESVDLMLHIWDQNYQGKRMLHGQSSPDGSFQFKDVPLEPNSVYAIMATYKGAAYFSEPILLESEDTLLEFEVPIYETTTDTSHVRAEQVHILFSFDQGGLRVWEVYLLSNLGEYTVKDAVTLEDGFSVTIKFTLPDNAANVSFESDDETRFVQFPGGFADTWPLVPGVDSSQVILSYILPYDGALTFTFKPTMKVKGLRFLIIQDPGIIVDGDDLIPDGTQTLQDGAAFDVYTREELPANESVEVIISGEPTTSMLRLETPESGTPIIRSSKLEIGIGVLVLGLALVGVGIWWWRKPPDRDNETVKDILEWPDFRDLVAQIVDLDETYQNGELSAEEYEQQRKYLIYQGKILLEDEEAYLLGKELENKPPDTLIEKRWSARFLYRFWRKLD
jgi:hypothetical protein